MPDPLRVITQTESWLQEVQEDVIDILRDLLERAESGEIQGIAYSAVTADNCTFGGEPQEPYQIMDDGSKRPGPRNRRAEMWQRSKAWLDEPGGATWRPSENNQRKSNHASWR